MSNETGFSTPTVKKRFNRFNRLVNLGVIKSVSPILDLSIILNPTDKCDGNKSADVTNIITRYKRCCKEPSDKEKEKIQINKRTFIKIRCDYCKTPLEGRIYLFRLANFERFFCCNECKMAYKKKMATGIKKMEIIVPHRRLNKVSEILKSANTHYRIQGEGKGESRTGWSC